MDRSGNRKMYTSTISSPPPPVKLWNTQPGFLVLLNEIYSILSRNTHKPERTERARENWMGCACGGMDLGCTYTRICIYSSHNLQGWMDAWASGWNYARYVFLYVNKGTWWTCSVAQDFYMFYIRVTLSFKHTNICMYIALNENKVDEGKHWIYL